MIAQASHHPPRTTAELPLYDPTTPCRFDLVIAGAGPSGLAVADRVSSAGLSVCIVDPSPLAYWPNNYGVWCDEFAAMGLDDCYEIVWPRAKVFLGAQPEDEKCVCTLATMLCGVHAHHSKFRFLYRPYARVDRTKLKRKLLDRCVSQGVRFHLAPVDSVTHAGGRSAVLASDGTALDGAMVLDATGHVRKLVTFDAPFEPGYQGAYGILARVESHPFDLDTMLFMDWRDDHTVGDPAMRDANTALPTFLYAMPFDEHRIFLEETSLVARPAVPFPELQARLAARLKHLGITVTDIEEEEFCLIPMGGVLPTNPQRVLGIGGTAGMVHPSTGYMVARMLGAAPTLGDAIVEQLMSVRDRECDAETLPGARDEAEAAEMSAAVWGALWPVQRLRQREFFNFGMEVLLKLDLQVRSCWTLCVMGLIVYMLTPCTPQETRDFFRAFFSLSDFHWQGFLSSRLTFLQLIGFGLSLFANCNNAARVNLVVKGLPGLVVMLARLAGTLQQGGGPPTVTLREPRSGR